MTDRNADLRYVLRDPHCLRLGTVADARGNKMVLVTVYVGDDGYGILIQSKAYTGSLASAIARENEPVWGVVSPSAVIMDLHRQAGRLYAARDRRPVEPTRPAKVTKTKRGAAPVQSRLI